MRMPTLFSLVEELEFDMQYQSTPIPYSRNDYERFVKKGIRRLCIDFGYEEESVFNYSSSSFARNITSGEEEYILLGAKDSLLTQVQADVNKMVSYSTDTIKVTNADKPYANINNDKTLIDTRRTELFFKIKAGGA